MKVIQIMAITPFLLFLMNTFGTNYLVLIGKEKVLKNIILICSILGFILSCIIVTHYSYIGISITLVSIWGIRGVLTFYYAKKFQKQSEKNSME